MKIGTVELQGKALLAPLAGIGALPFRLLCKEFGAALLSSEMMSCHGLNRRQPNTHAMLATSAEDHPVAFQLFGAEPGAMANASLIAAEAGADIIDLNFGCPVPKVVRHRGGSALLKEPDLLQDIVKACVKVCPKPVTVKIRAGWDMNQINACDIAKRAENAGASALTIHARTRSQRFEGKANWDYITDVVKAVSIPVVGNGDIVDAPSAKRMLDQTGCAAVMVGRGVMGRPWIFKQINHFFKTGECLPEPGLKERITVIRKHYSGLKTIKNDRTARLEMRKHAAWYLKGLPAMAAIRRRINVSNDEAEFLAILEELESGSIS